jgi:stage III sporulation protein AH
MINKKNLWFLTLFSLILVLSIYYITMPNELLLTANTKKVIKNETPTISINEIDSLVALRVNSDSIMEKEIEELELILTNADSSVDEKNIAYEKIKKLNTNRGEEEKLEQIILEKYNLKSFVKINDSKVNITIESSDHTEDLANKIMRSIQENYNTKKYITIKFQS